MSGSSKSEGLVRVRQSFPLTGKGATAVSHLVLKILEGDRWVQKITLEVGKPVVTETLVPHDSPLAEISSYHDIMRQRPMLEYVPVKPDLPVHSQLFEMFNMVTTEDLDICCVLVGDLPRFNRWVGQPMRSVYVFGTQLRTLERVPGDVFFVCGAPFHDSMPDDLVMTVKGMLI